MTKVERFSSLQDEARCRLALWSDKVPSDVLSERPVNLKTLGSYWGVKAVIERQLDVGGLLYRHDADRSTIFLKQDDVLGRRRFSWAHELGHIVMANRASPQVACRKVNNNNRALERCCDLIATEILMPQDSFMEVTDQSCWSLRAVRSLASTFQVTVQAAARRLLELIDEPALISVWRPQSELPLRSVKYSWAIPNTLGKSFRPEVRWQTNPVALWPIYEASSNRTVVEGACKVLMKVQGETLYKWVHTEALAVGRGDKQTLLGFHYLSRVAA